MKLKGVRKLERTINNFLAPFECTCFLGTDFAYWRSDSTIEIALVASEELNEGFLNSVLRHDPAVSADIFLWSLLHELGHHETLDSLTDEENQECDDIKEAIEKGECAEIDYYDLLNEVLATEWAVEYANTHIEELAKFWGKVQKAIMHFYKINEVEDI